MNKKWHTLKLCEIEKQLNTSLEGGLSAREARVRLDAEKKDSDGDRYSLFVPKRASILRTLVTFYRTPCMSVLILMSALAFAFGLSLTALLIFLISLAGAFTCGIILLSTQTKQAKMYEYASPMTKVKRGGEIMYTDGRNVVSGDVMLLSAGDLLPCDARIVFSKDLAVKELIHTNEGIRNRNAEKYACDIDECGDMYAPDARNMLYAGSAVISGEAVAVAVETAENVYLADYCDGSLLRTAEFSEREMTQLDIFFRKLMIVCYASLTVLAVASMLVQGGEGFLNVFLMMLASISLISADAVRIIKVSVFSSMLARLAKANKTKKDTSAYIRDIKTAETLSKVTDILLLGKAAFTHGEFHIGDVYLPTDAAKEAERGDAETKLMSHVYTYIKALDQCKLKTELVLDGVVDSLFDHLTDIHFDRKGADLILNSLYFAPNTDGTSGYACAETPEGVYRVILTYDGNILEFCSNAMTYQQELSNFESTAESTGGKCIYIVTETNGDAVLEGALSVIETNDEAIDGFLEKLDMMEIRTISMISDKASANLLGLSRHLSKNIAYAEDFKKEDRDITSRFGEYTAYVGFSSEDNARLVDLMRKGGSVVAAYGVGNEYYEVMSHADMAISCDVLRYSSQKHLESVYEKLPQEGRDSNTRCSQKTRFLSKMLVHRANSSGGGLSSVVNAIFNVRGANTALCRSLLYYASLMSVLLPLSAMSCILGVELLNGAQAACFASASLILAAIAFSEYEVRGELAGKCCGKNIQNILSDRKNIPMLVLRASLSILFAVFVKLLDSLAIFGENASYSMPVFISVIMIAAAELLIPSLASSGQGRGIKSTLSRFLAVYASLLAICGVMTHEFFERELFPNGIGIPEFFLTLLYPSVHIISVFVFNLILKKSDRC